MASHLDGTITHPVWFEQFAKAYPGPRERYAATCVIAQLGGLPERNYPTRNHLAMQWRDRDNKLREKALALYKITDGISKAEEGALTAVFTKGSPDDLDPATFSVRSPIEVVVGRLGSVGIRHEFSRPRALSRPDGMHLLAGRVAIDLVEAQTITVTEQEGVEVRSQPPLPRGMTVYLGKTPLSADFADAHPTMPSSDAYNALVECTLSPTVIGDGPVGGLLLSIAETTARREFTNAVYDLTSGKATLEALAA